MTCWCVALLVSRVPCLCCFFRPQTFGVSRHLGHLDHGASTRCLAKTFGAPTTGAGYLLVNNPVFQLEPFGLSVLCCVLCAAGCCVNKPENFFLCLLFFVPFCPRLVSQAFKVQIKSKLKRKRKQNHQGWWVGCTFALAFLSCVSFLLQLFLWSRSFLLRVVVWLKLKFFLSFSWAAFLTLLPLLKIFAGWSCSKHKPFVLPFLSDLCPEYQKGKK